MKSININMNRIAPDIPNMIKQPAQCCVYCGKSYRKKTNLEKHVIICDLLNKSKSKVIEDSEDDLPSQRKMYELLLEFASKVNKLEEKVEELNKWVVKKKNKINLIEWLNAKNIPDMKFDNIIENIIIEQDDINYLFQNSFIDTLNHIFSKNIYNMNETGPLFAFSHKTNVFYYYENQNNKWAILSNELLIKFLNKVHMKVLRWFSQYKKDNAIKMQDDECFSILCDKTSFKIMNIDFNQENILSKIKTNMYSKMKTDIKGLVEYEFES